MAKGKLRHVRVEPAANGALVTVSREPSKMQKGAMLYDSGEERHVHKTADDAGAHVTKLLKEHGVEGNGPDDGVKRSGNVGNKTEKY
jgi:hypothetical protein